MNTNACEPGTAYVDCTGKTAPVVGAVISMRYGDAYKITRVDEFHPPRIGPDGTVSTHMIWFLPVAGAQPEPVLNRTG